MTASRVTRWKTFALLLILLACVAVAGSVLLRNDSVTADAIGNPPTPLDPTRGQLALLGIVGSAPVTEVDAAKDHFPVPFVLKIQHGTDPEVTVSGRAGAPLRVDVDDSKGTGKGGKDALVLVDLTPGTEPSAQVLIETLDDSSDIHDVTLTFVIPFDGFAGPSSDGPINLVIGLDTDGGQLPESAVLTLVPGETSGSSRTATLSGSLAGQSPTVVLTAGHTHGDVDTGITDYGLFAIDLDPAPSDFAAELEFEESETASPLVSTLNLDWDSDVPVELLLDVIEDEDYVETPGDADYASSLRISNAPITFDFDSHLSDPAGTYSLSAVGSTSIGFLDFERIRLDGARLLFSAEQLPSSTAWSGLTNGGFGYASSAPTADIELYLSEGSGYSGSDDWLDRDVKQIHVVATDVPDLTATMSTALVGEARTFTLQTSGSNVPSLTLGVSSALGQIHLSNAMSSKHTEHAASLIDKAGTAGFGVRVLDVGSATVVFDPVEVETSVAMITGSAALQNLDLDLEATSPIADSYSVLASCVVDEMPFGTASFATDFVGSVSYSSDPETPLSEVSCESTLDELVTEFHFEDIPGSFAFAFDPDTGVDADFGSSEMASLDWYLRTNDGSGLPGSGQLFDGDPLTVARLRLDDLSTLVAGWSNDGGLDVKAQTGVDDDFFGGLQLGVSTSAGTLPVFADIGGATVQEVVFEDNFDQALDLALAGINNLQFSHVGSDAAVALTADVKPGSAIPFEFDLESLFDTTDMFSGACSIEPLPAGGIELSTDYSTMMSMEAGDGVDRIECAGHYGGLVFSTALTGVPGQVDVELDPAGHIAVTLSDPMESLVLDLSDPYGLVTADTLLGTTVRRAVVTVEDIPSMEARWAVDPVSPAYSEISIAAIDPEDEIGAISLLLDEDPPVGPIPVSIKNRALADHSPPAPNCGLTLNTITSATTPAQLFANIQSTPFTTFSLSPSGLTMNVTTTAPQVCAININTSYPTNLPDLTPQALFTLNCTLDRAPEGTFSFTTDFNSSFATTAPSRIDEFDCNGQNGNVLYSLLFQDLPESMGMTLGSGVSLVASNGSATNPLASSVGLAMVELKTTDETFGLLGTSGLFGQDLRYLGARLDDAPTTTFNWVFDDSESSIAVSTTPSQDTAAEAVGGIQFMAASRQQPELPLSPPTPEDTQILRFLKTPDPDAQILEARLFGLEQIEFSQLTTTGPGGEPPVRSLTAIVGVDTPRDLLGVISTVLPVDGATPAILKSSSALVTLEGDITFLELTTDAASQVGYEANEGGTISRLALETDDRLIFVDPGAAEETGLSAPLPTTMSIELTDLPDDLDLAFEQTGLPGGESSTIEVDLQASGNLGRVLVHSSKPDPDDTEGESLVADEQTATLEDVPASLELSVSTSSTPAQEGVAGSLPVTTMSGNVEASGPLGRIFMETIDPVVADPETNRWTKFEILDLPPYVQLSLWDNTHEISVDMAASDVEFGEPGSGTIDASDGIGVIRLLQTTVLPGEELEIFEPFTEGSPGNGECYVQATPFQDEIAERAYSLDLQGHIDDVQCDTFGVEHAAFDDTEDHVITMKRRTHRLAEGGGAQWRWLGEEPNRYKAAYVDFVNSLTSVQFSGLQGVDLKLDLREGEIPPVEPAEGWPEEGPPPPTYIPGGIVEFSAPSVDPHPILIGSNDRFDKAEGETLVPNEQLQLIRIENIPDSIWLQMSALESVDFDSSESAGRIDVYTGPRGGAGTGVAAQRFIIENSPDSFTIDYDGVPDDPFLDNDDPWLFDWSYNIEFDASNQFRVLGVVQDPAGRTLLGFDLEDLSVNLAAEGLGYTPCDPVIVPVDLEGNTEQVDTCYGLLKAGAQFDATGSSSDEGVSGFLLYWPILEDPENLENGDAETNPDDVEYVPMVTLIFEDFQEFEIAAEIQLDPINLLAPFYPIDLEVSGTLIPVFGEEGAVVFDFWDQDFDACYDPTPEDEANDDDVCVEVSVNGSDYIANSPWHFWPLPHDQNGHFDVLD